MSSNRVFNEALGRMVSGVAYTDAIRHMYDRGLSADKIVENLDYPCSKEKVLEVIREYEASKETGMDEYELVETTNQYGKRCFIKVRKNREKKK